MKKYDSYKDSGIEYLNKIPAHWQELRMRFIGYLYGGLSGKSANDFNQLTNEDNKCFIPFTNIANNFRIDPESLQTVAIAENEKQNRVKKDDLFFLMSSENYDDVGKSAVLLDDLEETYLNSFCKGFRITKENIVPKFLNYQLHSKQLRHNLLTGANGFTRINLKIDKVIDLLTALPPLEEQTAIASFLDRKTAEIEELIADKKRLLELYEEEKTAIINKAVTKGLDPNVPMKDSGIEWLGEIPEHWEVKKLKYVAKIGNGKDHKNVWDEDGVYPIYGSGGIFGKSNEFIYDKPSVLLGRKGTIDKPQFVEVPFWAVDTTYYTIINEDLVLPYYFFLLTNTIDFNKYKYGSAVPSMTQEVLKEILFAVPSLLEQEVIVHHIESECSKIDFKKAQTEELIELLTEYHTALISEAVTGKIKVTEN